MKTKQPELLLTEALEILKAIEDPLEQSIATTEFINQLRDATVEVGEIRRESVQTLHNIGWGYQRIADKLNLSKPRLQQLIKNPAPVKRAGVIESKIRIATAEMRASKASDQEIVKALIPRVRAFRGGRNVTIEQMAQWMNVRDTLVAQVAKSVDAKLAK